MKKTLAAASAIAIIIIVAFAYFLWDSARNASDSSVYTPGYATTTVTVGDYSFVVEVADTDELRIKGLSGRKSLPEGRGMLFVFPHEDFYGFWMKDMRFSIDIIGLDDTRKVGWLERDMEPDSFPKVFTPPRPVSYVIELPSGSIDALNLSIGTTFSW